MQRFKSYAFFSLGLVLSSLIISYAFYAVHVNREQHISVRGLAQREVDANVGIWKIRFNATGNILDDVYQQIANHKEAVVKFLLACQLPSSDLSYGIPRVEDHGKYGGDANKRMRYTVEMSIVVDTTEVRRLYQAAQQAQKLIQLGVHLDASRWDAGMSFLFTNLNDIKPEMIRQANLHAKKVAEQIATDAGLKLGSLRSVVQGGFSIEDTHIPTKKQVRVVTHVKYGL